MNKNADRDEINNYSVFLMRSFRCPLRMTIPTFPLIYFAITYICDTIHGLLDKERGSTYARRMRFRTRRMMPINSLLLTSQIFLIRNQYRNKGFVFDPGDFNAFIWRKKEGVELSSNTLYGF